jgi:two-component system LytT family sensor kinase
MNIRFKISLCISAALTLLFVFPWTTLIGEELYLKTTIPRGTGILRLLYLSVTVFAASMVFFKCNFLLSENRSSFRSRWLKEFVHIALNILLVVVITAALTSLSAGLFDLKRSFIAFAFFRNLIIALITLLIARGFEMITQSRHDRIQLLALQKENAEAELARLKKQVDPHFLFNCLNSLTGLIRTNPKDAVRFVDHLSETFRYALDHHRHDLVTVREELEFLNAYLYMMTIRFGDGLSVTIHTDEITLNKKIPHFGLQLLVENAVAHNIVSVQRPLTIHISACHGMITITNNLQLKKTFKKGYGIGLSSLSKHYALLNEPPIEVHQTANDFKVTLTVI